MSAYQSMTAWREKRKVAQAKYEANMAQAAVALQTAWNDAGFNVGEIAANAAIKRIQNEAKVKQEKLAASRADQDNQPYAPKYSKFSESSSATLDGGSRIDLTANTLTLPNGTVIDLKTGIKRVNVTV